MMQDIKNEIRLRPKHGPRKAEETVRRLRSLCGHLQKSPGDDGDSDGNQDGSEQLYQKQTMVQAYNLWIHALAKSGWEDAGYLAEDVVDEMRFVAFLTGIIDRAFDGGIHSGGVAARGENC